MGHLNGGNVLNEEGMVNREDNIALIMFFHLLRNL